MKKQTVEKLPWNFELNQGKAEQVVPVQRSKPFLYFQWTDCIMDRILKKVEVGKFITTALKRSLKLVKLQSLVAKCCKMRKI